MTYLTISYSIMLVVFVAYVLFIWLKYGVQKSISDSYYILPKNINFLFTLFCWGFAFPAVIIGVGLTNNFLMFLAGGGICFVGAAAAFKQELTKTVHMIGAYSGVAFGQLSIFFDFHLYYVNIIFIVSVLIIQLLPSKLVQNKIWWQEILAFLSICYVLGVNIL
jgi:hypothetical protein